MRKFITGGFGAFIMLTSLIVSGKHEGNYIKKITLNYKTAHLDWGKGAKNLNALFIVARKGGREVVEIIQRLPMGYEAVTTVNAVELAVENIYEGAVEGTSVYEKKLELLKKLEKKYSLIVIGNFDFKNLPPEAQFKILSQVSQGAGLVIVYPRRPRLRKVFSKPVAGADEILSLTPLKGLPAKAQKVPVKELVKTYQFKKGRIALVDYKANHGAHYTGMALTAPNDFSNRWQAEYENSMLLLMRSMLWSTGRNFAPITVSGLSKELLPVSEKIKIESPNAKEQYSLKVRVRDEFNDIVKEFDKQLSGSIELSLPALSAGKYYMDIILKDKAGTLVNLGARSFYIKSIVGKLSLSTGDKESFKTNEKLKAVLKLQKPLEEKSAVAISLVDSPYGRVWFEKNIELNAGKKELEIDIDKYYMPTIAGYLKCSVLKKGTAVAKCEKLLFFPKRKQEIYPTISWSSVQGEHLAPFYSKQVVDELGWRAGLNHPRPDGKMARAAALLNQRFVPYTVGVGLKESKENKGWTKQYNWFFLSGKDQKKMKTLSDQSFYNPEIREIWRQGVERRIKNIIKYGPAVYNLGDENNFSVNAGFSPSDNKEFKNFLEHKYGSIAKLNEKWGSSYKSFKDVKHYPLQEAKAKKIFAAWFDHRQFMEKQYADIHHFLTSEIKKRDPQALVGAEGSVPGDLERTIKGMEFWGPYSNLVMDEVLRSIAPEKIRTLWWGGYVGSHGGRGKYPWPLWKDLLAGTVNGNAWFSASVASSESCLGSDMDFAGYLKKLMPYLDSLRFGIAQLLITTPLKKDGVAVLWSHASDNARLLDERFVNPRDSMGAFIKYSYHTGLNFDFVTESMMKNGLLKDYKVLFLFGSSSVSVDEAKAIKAFVQNGGIVVADINPGLIDKFCVPVKNNPLTELFGNLLFDNVKIPALGKVSVNKVFNGQKLRFESLKALTVSGIPAFSVKEFGKGKAILLNFSFAAASNTCVEGTSLSSFLDELLAACKVVPGIEVSGVNKEKTMLRVRSGNGCELIGVLADKTDIGKTAEFTLPNAGYIYEVDSRFIAESNKWNAKLDKPFKLFCVFKNKPSAPVVAASCSKIKRGGLVDFDLRKLEKGGVYFMTVTAPDGKVISLCSKVFAGEIPKNYPLRFAFNDDAGRYVVTFKDVRTGLVQRIKIEVAK